MDYRQVLSRLIEIEQAIGVLDAISLRRMIVETEETLLQSEREWLQALRRKEIEGATGTR